MVLPRSSSFSPLVPSLTCSIRRQPPKCSASTSNLISFSICVAATSLSVLTTTILPMPGITPRHLYFLSYPNFNCCTPAYNTCSVVSLSAELDHLLQCLRHMGLWRPRRSAVRLIHNRFQHSTRPFIQRHRTRQWIIYFPPVFGNCPCL